MHTADMCILLSPFKNVVFEQEEHEAMSDKEVIMVALNLRGKLFIQSNLHKSNIKGAIVRVMLWRLRVMERRNGLRKSPKIVSGGQKHHCSYGGSIPMENREYKPN